MISLTLDHLKLQTEKFKVTLFIQLKKLEE